MKSTRRCAFWQKRWHGYPDGQSVHGLLVLGVPAGKTGEELALSPRERLIFLWQKKQKRSHEMGCTVTTLYDVGVAGIHRLFLNMG